MTDERLELLPMAIAFGIVMVATFGLIRITQTMTYRTGTAMGSHALEEPDP